MTGRITERGPADHALIRNGLLRHAGYFAFAVSPTGHPAGRTQEFGVHQLDQARQYARDVAATGTDVQIIAKAGPR